MAPKKKGGAKKKSAAKKKSGAKKSAAKKKSATKKSAKKGGAKKKTTTKRAGATAKKTKRAAKTKTKRAPNPAFMRPMQPDEALSAVVGSSPMPRTEITKRLWGYIRKNGLQDAKERRMINADDKLTRVFGGKKQVSMFEMTRLVNQHIK
ncbi:MAG TPA: SWIB/MDM2 domain-containing protein [Gemmatimonadaceae bacterium]|nr:SWIB/MDM2 domain-containing protein [Gemmatimonadaceae bacterium]